MPEPLSLKLLKRGERLKGSDMLKLTSVVAISVVLVGGGLAFPYFSQAEASQETAALPKGDRLPVSVCIGQTWPRRSRR